MPIEITGLATTCGQNSCESTQLQVARNEPTAAQDETGKPMTTETVTLTDLAQQLKSIERNLAAQPVVDSHRVDNVKQALRDGNYDFSAMRVAEKFMRFEAQLA